MTIKKRILKIVADGKEHNVKEMGRRLKVKYTTFSPIVTRMRTNNVLETPAKTMTVTKYRTGYVQLTQPKIANKSKVYGSTSVVINALGLDTQGEIVQIENLTGSVFTWLDRYCGIDWIIKTHDEHVQGVAARIQFTSAQYSNNPHNSFTIRYANESGQPTEYAKRYEAINKGYFYPYWTLQAFVKKEEPTHFLSGAIIKTKDLYDFTEKYDFLVSKDRKDNQFAVVKWSDLVRTGYKVFIKENYGY